MTLKALVDAVSLLTPYDTPGSRKVRIGAANDGGYVMIDQLRPTQTVFSYGLSWNVAYEYDLAQRGHRIFMFDHTIEALTLQHENFTWAKEGIAAQSRPDEFLYTLADHVNRFAPNQTGMILKMDVEGAEWDVLADLPLDLLCRFEQVVMELHDLRLYGDAAWRRQTSVGLGKLAQLFTLHNVHANNHAPIVLVDGVLPVADVIEVSYIRRDLSARQALSSLMPSHLDRANDPLRPDLPLLFFPYMPANQHAEGAANEALGNLAEKIDQSHARYVAEDRLTRAMQRPTAAAPAETPALLRQLTPGSALRILCVSVHPVLEFDEIRLFESMGHSVFSLGFYFSRETATDLRPALAETDWHRECRAVFSATGCSAVATAESWRVKREFCAGFDVIVVHHNYAFIAANWAELSGLQVVWRTIGQETHWAENAMRPFRKQGAKIVRWSPEERHISGYIGADAVIRAAKDPLEWEGWTGYLKRIVTFNNNFRARGDALSYGFHSECVADLPFDLYGLGNSDVAEWHGVADYSQQQHLLQTHCAAFVTGSIPAPYTLGFIEAWMTGIPVVHVGKQRFCAGAPGVYEIDHLIVDGESGFMVDDVAGAKAVFSNLLADDELGRRISKNGRSAAIRYFGVERAKGEWTAFFRDHITC